MDSCYRHDNVETGRRCTRCGRPACSECLRQASVGAHCLECVRESRPSTAQRVRVRVATGPPHITYGLIAVNVVAYLVTQGSSQLYLDMGLRAINVDLAGEWHRVITSAFLHASIMHIAFNMLVLFQLGSIAERLLGPTRFAGVYALSLLGGSIGAMLLSDARTFTVGASGAVYGLMGAMAVLTTRRGLDLWSSGIGGLLLINVFISFVVPNISIGGHMGGLAVGAAATWVLDPGLRPNNPRISNSLALVFIAGGLVTLFMASLFAAGIAVDRL